MRATTYRQVLTGIILAGGAASRMGGCAKAFLKIGKGTLIDMQLSLLRKIFKKIIIVTNSPQGYRNLKGVKLVSDIIPGIGPLGGIFSGLLASKDKYNFVIACDMPYINLELIKYMYKNTVGYDAVIPKINNKYEPLFAIYSKNCLKYIKELLDNKTLKIRKLFPKIKLKAITRKEILKFALPKDVFMNINTPQDINKIFYD